MIYAGQEIGQRGRRDAIAWDHAREGVRDRYERLIAVREDHPALGPEGNLDRVGYHVASGDLSSGRSSPAATFTPTTWWRSAGATRTNSSSSSSTSLPNQRASRSALTTPTEISVTDESCVVVDGEGTERIRVDDVAVVREAEE